MRPRATLLILGHLGDEPTRPGTWEWPPVAPPSPMEPQLPFDLSSPGDRPTAQTDADPAPIPASLATWEANVKEMNPRILFLAAIVAVTVSPTSSSLPTAGTDLLKDAPAPEDDTCVSEDTSGGFGDSVAQCDYTCPKSVYLTVDVESSDEVFVTGSAKCGGASARCTGQQSCAAQSDSATKNPGTGSCNARSDEAWSSYLRVECGWSDGATCAVACLPPTAEMTANLLAVRDQAVGLLCVLDDCWPVIPRFDLPTLEWIIDEASPVGTANETLQELLTLYEDAIESGADKKTQIERTLLSLARTTTDRIDDADDAVTTLLDKGEDRADDVNELLVDGDFGDDLLDDAADITLPKIPPILV